MTTSSSSTQQRTYDIKSFSTEEQTEAQQLLDALQQLTTQQETLDTQLKQRESELSAYTEHNDQLNSMRDENQSLKQKISENNEFLATANQTLKTVETSSTLEQKLVKLRSGLTEVEGSLYQHQISYQKYESKLSELRNCKERSLKEASDILASVSAQISHDLSPEAEAMCPIQRIDALTAICTEREKELAQLHESLDQLIQRDKEVTSVLQALQENLQEAIPRVEAEKDEVAQSILAEWDAEKQHLIGIYGKLCVINREQNYHLMRGTHIKRVSDQSVSQIGVNERRLDLDNTELAREVNALRDRVNITEADVRSLLVQLTHVKKLNDTERKNFQLTKATAEQRLEESNQLRQEMQIENNELRKLKGELLTVLQSIRENQISMQRSVLSDPQLALMIQDRMHSESP